MGWTLVASNPSDVIHPLLSFCSMSSSHICCLHAQVETAYVCVYIYNHRVFLQPPCLPPPGVGYFFLSPTFLPNACVFSPCCIVIVASIFLAPSLTLSFEMLWMLYLTIRCIFLPPKLISFVLLLRRENDSQWPPLTAGKGAVCPANHPATTFHSLAMTLLQKPSGPLAFLPRTPRYRGTCWELELNVKNSFPDSALKMFQILWQWKQTVGILFTFVMFGQAAPSKLLVFSGCNLIVHYQNKHFWLLYSKTLQQNML